RHPTFVLHLTLPGSFVDVNVHPQKREVRLRQEQAIRDWIVKAIQKTWVEEESFSYPVTPLAAVAPYIISEPPPPQFEWKPEPVQQQMPSMFQELPSRKIVRVLATFLGYIVVERPSYDGFSLIDQRAARSRI